MKKISIFVVCGLLSAASLKAQNIFPATGRAGIYTTTPAASLQIKGGARIGTLTNYLNVDSATGSLNFVGTAGYRVANNTFAFTSASQPLAGLYFNSTNVRYEFRNTTGTPAMVIGANAAGNVGIGTTSPLSNYKLTVQSTPGGIAALSGSTGVTTELSVGRTVVEADLGIAANSGNYFNGTVAGDGILRVEDGSKKLVLGAGVGVNPTMVVTSHNVGIGTTTPVANLDIAGTAQVEGNFTLGGTSTNAQQMLFINGSGYSEIQTIQQGIAFNNTILAFPAASNVGIGTYTPAAKLDIAGNVKIADGTQGAGKVLTSDANGVASWQTPATPQVNTIIKQQSDEIADLKARLEKLEALMNVQATSVNNQNAVLSSALVASLQQNAPNPFSSNTVIKYYLPASVNAAQILITDSKGNAIKTITLSGKGNGQVTLSASSLASGTYKYSLVVDGKLIDTKTMVLTK